MIAAIAFTTNGANQMPIQEPVTFTAMTLRFCSGLSWAWSIPTNDHLLRLTEIYWSSKNKRRLASAD